MGAGALWFSRQNPEALTRGVGGPPRPQEAGAAMKKTHPAQRGRMAAPANEDIAVSCRILTRLGCQQIVRDAFEYAKKFGLSLIHISEPTRPY